MSNINGYVYARQIPPEDQMCNDILELLKEGETFGRMIMAGNDSFNGHNDDIFRVIDDCAEDILCDYSKSCGDVKEWCKAEFTKEVDNYSSSDVRTLEQCLNKYYTSEKHPQWTADEAAAFADAYLTEIDGKFNGYSVYDKSPQECRTELLSIYTGEEYATTTINGYSQGDWQTVYYPKSEYDDKSIETLEIMYFDKGEMWMVHDDVEPPETPDDIDGYTIYVLHNARKEIAEVEDVSPDKVCLYTGEYVRAVAYRASPDNPQIDVKSNKSKATIERD